jgi:hypothetical protein
MGFLDVLQAIFGGGGAPPARDTVPQRHPSSQWQGNRTTRIRQEVHMIAPRFADSGGVACDEAQGDWLMIPKYPLPAKWQDRWCKLLLIFPETYPMAPPIGFYLNRQFTLKHGGTDPHFVGFGAHNAPDLRAQGWYWYCVRIVQGAPGGWRPSPDYRQPDNLWTFLAMVRETLTNDF